MKEGTAQVIREMENFARQLLDLRESFSVHVQAVEKLLAEVKESFQEIQSLKQELQTLEGELTRAQKKFFQDFQDTFSRFFQTIDRLEARYETGLKVRKDYSGEVILLVFGLVKAGKSALGNVVAGVPVLRKLNLLEESSLFKGLNLQIEVWKDGRKEVEDHFPEFEEDAVEATNRIQIFRLGALTWVDTPGVGSMTRENEKIAREFTEHADLVLFLTSSEQPMRDQELDKMKELAQFKEKPWIIAITKSDKRDSDVDEETGKPIKVLRPKPPEVRREQEKFVEEELKKLPWWHHTWVDTQVISLSAKLVEEALKRGDFKQFEDSNLPQFYRLLLRLIKEKGYNLKVYNVFNQAIVVLKTLLKGETDEKDASLSLTSLKEKIIHLKREIERLEKEFLHKGKSKIVKNTRLEANRLFDEYVKKAEVQVLNQQESDPSYLCYCLEELLSRNLEEVVNEYLSKIMEKTEKFSLVLALNEEQFALQEKKEKVPKKLRSYYKRERKDFWAQTVKVITLGLVKLYEPAYTTKEIEEEMVVGTNKDEVYQRFVDFLERDLPVYVEEELAKIAKSYFSPLRDRLDAIVEKVEGFQRQLETKLQELRKKMSLLEGE